MSDPLLLIDADSFIYAAACVCEQAIDWGDGMLTRSADLEHGKQVIDETVAHIRAELGAKRVVLALTDKTEPNWRLKVLESYKANRKGTVRPLALPDLIKYVSSVKDYNVTSRPQLEADDVLGLMATSKKIKGRRIVVSIDKDLNTVPGELFNPQHPERGVKRITVEEADYNHLFQTLVGDKTDGYTGLPGCGPVGAEKILDREPATRWPAILEAFEKSGYSAIYALRQARVAHIMRNGDYTPATAGRAAKIRLWKPT